MRATFPVGGVKDCDVTMLAVYSIIMCGGGILSWSRVSVILGDWGRGSEARATSPLWRNAGRSTGSFLADFDPRHPLLHRQ